MKYIIVTFEEWPDITKEAWFWSECYMCVHMHKAQPDRGVAWFVPEERVQQYVAMQSIQMQEHLS